jgi:LacI family transcriptional regulator
MRSNHPRVAIIIAAHTTYGKDALQGMFQYVSARSKWEIQYEGIVAPAWLSVAIDQWKVNGIVAQITNHRTWRVIVDSKVPCVNVSGCFREGVANVYPDNQAAGRLAAEHLMDRGLKAFAYCGVTELYSRDRERGFVGAIRASGHARRASQLRITPNVDNWYADYLKLYRWIGSLPRPVGVMACNDHMARRVLWACKEQGLKVPDEISVIGVDDDAVEGGLCEIPLSSVALPIRLIGQQAAQMLDRMMRGSVAGGNICVPPTGVVSRQSTDHYASADPESVAVLRYIRENADKPISVGDIVRSMSISRRCLEKRFLKTFKFTPGAEILRVRLEHAKRLLCVTDTKITRLCLDCGFPRYSTFSHMFLRKVGMTPNEYRTQFRVRNVPSGVVDSSHGRSFGRGLDS